MASKKPGFCAAKLGGGVALGQRWEGNPGLAGKKPGFGFAVDNEGRLVVESGEFRTVGHILLQASARLALVSRRVTDPT